MKSPRLPHLRLAWACAFGLAACFRDDGIIDPAVPANLPVLASYSGKAVTGDNSFDTERLLNTLNPQIALVWQFVGIKEYRDTYSKSLVSADAPFQFGVELRDAPPKDVIEHEEVAIGEMWLYCDADSNGRFDRLFHPEMAKRNRITDSLQQRLDSLLALLRKAADRRETRVSVRDTLRILPGGNMVRLHGNAEDTVWRGDPEVDGSLWSDVLQSRYRILADLDPWEAFLYQRKKIDDRTLSEIADRGPNLRMEFCERIRLSPRPGREEEFEALLERASGVNALLHRTFERNYLEAYRKGWLDYPYQGNAGKGEDWVMGRSRFDFILYLKNPEALHQLRTAERSSAFVIEGMPSLHAGYNLVHCDEQYRCQVRASSAPIEVQLGSKELYFNPPSVPPEKPVADPEPAEMPAESLRVLEGTYDYIAARPLRIAAAGGRLWADIPDWGLLGFLPAGGGVFFHEASGSELRFDRDPAGGVHKVFVYFGQNLGIGVPTESDSGWPAFRAKAESLSAVRIMAGAESRYRAYAGLFAAAGDTLTVKADADGKGLWIGLPGYAPLLFAETEGGDFRSLTTDLGVRFESGNGAPSALWRRRGSVEEIFPNVDRSAQAWDTSLAAAPDSSKWAITSSSPGSGSDGYRGPDGKARFACAEDGRYLRSGDGVVEALESLDGLSLGAGGEWMRLRIAGRAGAVVAWTGTACGTAADAGGYALLRFRGGRSPDSLTDKLAPDQWFRPGKTAIPIPVGPIRVPSDPYYIRIERLRTAGPQQPFAFDGYEMRSEELP